METARKLGFGENSGCGFGFWVPGVTGHCFYSTGLGLGVRATPSQGGARSVLLPDSGRVRVLPEVGDDERVPRVGERGERKRGVTGWAEGKGKRAGGGGFWPAGNEKEKGRVMGWAGKGLGERKKFSIFRKGFKHFQFKFKLKDLNLS